MSSLWQDDSFQLSVHWDPQVFFCQAIFQLCFSDRLEAGCLDKQHQQVCSHQCLWPHCFSSSHFYEQKQSGKICSITENARGLSQSCTCLLKEIVLGLYRVDQKPSWCRLLLPLHFGLYKFSRESCYLTFLCTTTGSVFSSKWLSGILERKARLCCPSPSRGMFLAQQHVHYKNQSKY